MIKHGNLPSVMKRHFSEVPQADIQRSSFQRNHGLKTAFNSQSLIPIFWDEALPGDTMNLKMNHFGRLSTPFVPVMDNIRLETFFFAVPYRLVWQNWEKFNGQQDNPGDSTDYLTPQMTTPPANGVFAEQSLMDYFGIPTKVPNLSVNAFHFRAYNLIWNEWFRDETIQPRAPMNKGDGPDLPGDYTLLPRGKRHDYFTSCLPWPQKGPSVPIFSATATAPVISGNMTATGMNAPAASWSQMNGASQVSKAGLFLMGDATTNMRVPSGSLPSTSNTSFQVKQSDGWVANLSLSTDTSVNAIRQAFQLQKLYERDARGGTRYTETIRSHFGVVSDDARLQRPEYLGGGSTAINITPIAQTSSSDSTTPQGNLAAIGTTSSTGHGFVKSFTEHCLIIGLANVTADLTYQQGLDRMWSRRTRWDYYWPALAHLGEQAVLNKEIYAQGTGVTNGQGIIDNQVFGYQERFAEYRYKNSTVTGRMRSNATQSLDIWHLSQKFNSLPTLSAPFIVDTPPLERILAVTDEPQILLDSYFNYICARPMPTYSVPGLVDHF